MIKLNDILQFPSFYRDRQQSVREVQSVLLDMKVDYGKTEFVGKSGKYTPRIVVFGNIGYDSRVKISCNCQSFKFEFASVVNRDGSLINPKEFNGKLLLNPRIKNRYGIVSGCKHIIAFANTLYRSKDKI